MNLFEKVSGNAGVISALKFLAENENKPVFVCLLQIDFFQGIKVLEYIPNNTAFTYFKIDAADIKVFFENMVANKIQFVSSSNLAKPLVWDNIALSTLYYSDIGFVWMGGLFQNTHRRNHFNSDKLSKQIRASLMQNHRMIIFSCSLAGVVWSFNYAAAEICGYSRIEAGAKDNDFLPTILQKKPIQIEKLVKRGVNNPQKYGLNVRIFDKWRSIKYLNLIVDFLYGDANTIVGFLVYGFETTTQTQAERHLNRVQNHLQAAQKINLAGSWEFNLEDGSLFWSLQMFQVYQLKPEVGTPTKDQVANLIHPDDRQMVEDAILKSQNNRISFEVVYRTKTFRDKNRILQARGSFFTKGKSEKIMLGVTQDITRKVRLESALKESRDRFRQIIEHFEDVLWIIDLSSRKFIYISPSFRSVFDRPPDAYYRNPVHLFNIIHPNDKQNVINSFFKQLKNKVWEVINYRMVKPDGSVGYLKTNTFPIYDNNGKMFRLGGYTQDVTKFVIAEQNMDILRKTQQEIERKDRVKKLRHLVEGQETERKRIAIDLHDNIGQLIASVKMQVHHLEQKTSPNSSPDLFNLFEHISSALDKTLSEIRYLASNLRPKILGQYGVEEAIEQLLFQYKSTSKSKMYFSHMGKLSKPMPEGTAVHLFRISQELINNALKHANANNIFVQLVFSDKQVQLWIEDDGIGFDPKAEKNKLGLGLSNIYQRAELLDGLLIMESEPTKGTSVMFEIEI